MSFGDFMSLMVLVAGVVGTGGIMAQVYRRRLEHKERIAELQVQGTLSAAPAGRSAEVEKLEQRLRVLERIATDKTTALASQIEDLRSPVN